MKYLLFLFLIISLVFSACEFIDQIGNNVLPGINIPLNQMNKDVQLNAPPEANTFNIGRSIVLVLENLTDNQILFPDDFGAQIFAQADGEWIPVLNDMGYPSGENLIPHVIKIRP